MNGYVANTPDPKLDELLSRGGIMSMLGSASLILLALALGGLLIKYLIVDTIVQESVHHSSRRNIQAFF